MTPPDPFRDIAVQIPNPSRVSVISADLARNLTPVRPLPSNLQLTLLAVAMIAIVAIGGALVLGFNGFAAMQISQRFELYILLLLCVIVLAASLVEQMIPGSAMRIRPGLSLLAAMILLGSTVVLLFPEFSLNRFVERGVPCLRAGTLFAGIGALCTWSIMRRGYLTNPVSAALTGAAFSGLFGVGMLALHCPLLNAAHILTWHFGVVLIAILGGLCLGWFLKRVS